MADLLTFPSWPQTGTPLTPGVVCTGFRPVTQEILAEVVRRIVVALHPTKIVLFGSYAYGHPTPDSDVDLLVVLETDQKPVERQIAVSRLIRPRPFPVNLWVRTPKEMEEALHKRDPFIRDILERGRVLHG
ncbi:MAG: nucleotidyltransferase domain-containing protein [Saprospiraceae bacterium]|nr:nucleotidyltransferase domain-containing protein [Saprospiraceae bacterium]